MKGLMMSRWLGWRIMNDCLLEPCHMAKMVCPVSGGLVCFGQY